MTLCKIIMACKSHKKPIHILFEKQPKVKNWHQ